MNEQIVMEKKKVLIIGAGGFVGSYLVKRLARNHRVWGTYHDHHIRVDDVTTIHLDIRDKAGLTDAVRRIEPSVIVHLAAMTDPEACEEHKADAYRINVEGTGRVAEAAETVGAELVYLSTDLVFDGTKGMYGEDDAPAPLSYYGETKRKGEQEVKARSSRYWIVRLALSYGWGVPAHRNFIDWMLGNLEKGEEISLFTDQYRSLVYVENAVEALDLLVGGGVPHGLYHLGGAERMERYEFGLRFCRRFGYPPGLLKPVLQSEFPYKAARPGDCSFCVDKLGRFGFRALSVDEGIDRLFLHFYKTFARTH